MVCFTKEQKKQQYIVFCALSSLHRLYSWQLSSVKVLVQCFPLVLLAHSLALYPVVQDNAKYWDCWRLELVYYYCSQRVFSCCFLQTGRALILLK